jgi:hypothetical protein
MPLMREAVSKEEWEATESGKPYTRPVRPARPEPERPVVENEIKFSDIPPDKFKTLDLAEKKPIRNPSGVLFIGYEVTISLKRGPGKPAEGETNEMKGWMSEGNFMELVRTKRKEIDQVVIHW